MVLYKDKDVVFAGFGKERFMMYKVFNGRLGYEHVHASADRVQCKRVVRGIGREYSDGVAWREGINGGLVSLWIPRSGVRRKRGKGGVEVVVYGRDILLEMVAFGISLSSSLYGLLCGGRTYCWKFGAGCPDHAELSHFSSSSQIKECKSYDADFLI